MVITIMTVAFVLLKITPGKEREVCELLRRVEGVEEVSVIFGKYDIHLRVDVPSVDELDDFVIDVRRLSKHIQSTTTLVCTDVQEKK
ncbi:MAG: Lrp/AsnC family transcriptional regulator [Thermoplasmata archaeon]